LVFSFQDDASFPTGSHRGSRDTHGTHTGQKGAHGHTDHTTEPHNDATGTGTLSYVC